MSLLATLKNVNLDDITALIMDVDGVLTDGSIVYSSGGDEIKTFHVRDGSGIKYWHRAGHVSAILSGRSSPTVTRRADELGICEVELGAKIKEPVFLSIAERLGVKPENCLYIGDDLPDIPPMRCAGVAIAVRDAAEEVKDVALAVTEACGGCGAVRELIEAVLKTQGRWKDIMARYL